MNQEQFKRAVNFVDFAEKVLGVHITLTPSSEGYHIRAVKKFFHGRRDVDRVLSHRELEDAKLDILGLSLIRMVIEVGGLDVLA